MQSVLFRDFLSDKARNYTYSQVHVVPCARRSVLVISLVCAI